MTGAVTVVGADTLAATLHGFADDLGDLGDAATAAGAIVVRGARLRARRRTGHLAASFTATPDGSGSRIGSPVVYAGVQEYGWSRHHITPSWALTSALADAGPAVTDVYARAVDDALGKVKGA